MKRNIQQLFIIIFVILIFAPFGNLKCNEKIWIFIPINNEGHIKLDGLAKVMNKHMGTFYNLEKYKGKVYKLNPFVTLSIKLLNQAPGLKGNVKVYWEKERIVIETSKIFFIKKRDVLVKLFLGLFGKFLKEKTQKYEYGLLSIPENIKGSKVVLLVHGIESDKKTWNNFTPFLEKNKISYMFFQYPNDQSISDSAMLLSKEIKLFNEKHPAVSIFAITHSMGALVVRSVIENKELSKNKITSILMFAPPNQGSYISILHPLLEFGKSIILKEITWVDCVFDGMSEAAVDLWPGSAFLRELNKRPRSPICEYQMIIGNKALIGKDQHSSLVKKLKKSIRGSEINKKIRKKMFVYFKDLNEIINKEGDGAVAIERTKLKGVDRILKVDKNHIDIHNLISSKTNQNIEKLILDQFKRVK
ncbi:MAG: hypothetical protein COA79_09695 [Planctomycetota bacterium]|nr:MAG: hypothetical protein COA79_09695 [Planctomycetota bacterium]